MTIRWGTRGRGGRDRSIASKNGPWVYHVVVAIAYAPLRRRVVEALRALGCVVWSTGDGRQAQARLSFTPRRDRERAVDVVIADHALPGRSGFDLLADARYRGSMVPFVILADAHTNDQEVRLDTRVMVIRRPLRAEDLCDAAAYLIGAPWRVVPGASGASVGVDPATVIPPGSAALAAWPPALDAMVHPPTVRRQAPGLGGAHGTLYEVPWDGEDLDPERLDDRRVMPRAEVGLWVDLDSLDDPSHSFCTNLSAAGLFLSGLNDYGLGHLFVGRFELPGQDRRIRALGKVVRRVHGGDGTPGCGARFVNICRQHRAAIASYVQETRATE